MCLRERERESEREKEDRRMNQPVGGERVRDNKKEGGKDREEGEGRVNKSVGVD